MIYSVSGKLLLTDAQTAVVECGGVGFKCMVSLNTLKRLSPISTQVTLLTYLNVREDAMDLFGFFDQSELDMFRMLISVSGVGPKAALSILSEYEPNRLCVFIASGDSKSITRAAGVGAKLAQRIVLELKDKMGTSAFATDEGMSAAATAISSVGSNEAVEALVSLGYSQSEAALAVGKLDNSLPVETLIKEGLKMLARF